VRKKITEDLAVEANYFVDKVSGASVDVLSNASVIKDERKQKSGTIEYLHDKTTYTASFINSTERDYISNTTSFSLSQDMFGDLTTLTLGWSRTRDSVGENNGTAFVPKVTWLGHAQSQSYTVGVSQILTKNLIGGLTFEVITDDGYLANPYRSVRYDDPNAKGYSLGSQIYPDTRTSTSVQGQAKYYLPYRAAVTGSYRYFHDTWGITAGTYEVDYTHPIKNIWILEGRLRYYKQNSASFYSDLFPFYPSQNFMARPRSVLVREHHHRRQGDLRLPTGRLEDLQARHRHGGREPDHVPLPRFQGYPRLQHHQRLFRRHRASLPLRCHRVPGLYLDVLLTDAPDAAPPDQQHGREGHADRRGIRHPIPEVPVTVHHGQALDVFDQGAETR
jgi:hypothetical protein